jgi:hypothetical protein
MNTFSTMHKSCTWLLYEPEGITSLVEYFINKIALLQITLVHLLFGIILD